MNHQPNCTLKPERRARRMVVLTNAHIITNIFKILYRKKMHERNMHGHLGRQSTHLAIKSLKFSVLVIEIKKLCPVN